MSETRNEPGPAIQDRAPCGCLVTIVAPCPGCSDGDVWSDCVHTPDPPALCEACTADAARGAL